MSQDGIPTPKSWNLLDVSTTGPETFVVVAITDSHDCDFQIEIDYIGRYQKGTYVVSDDGQPFRLAAAIATDTEWILPGQ